MRKESHSPAKAENQKSAEDAGKAAKRRSGREVIERLKDAASEEFGNNGFSRTKTAEIARKAGVSENLLFKHFGSKANLFNDTIFNPIERHFAAFAKTHPVRDDVAGDREAVSRQYISEMQRFMREHAEQILLLVMSKAFEAGEVNGIDKVSGLHQYLEHTSDIVRSRLAGRTRIDPRLTACISFGAILACEIFKDWLFPEDWGTPQEIEEATAEFVMGGFDALVRETDGKTSDSHPAAPDDDHPG